METVGNVNYAVSIYGISIYDSNDEKITSFSERIIGPYLFFF